MAEVTVYSAERMKQIEDETIVDGDIVDGYLILKTRAGTEINAGQALGGPGIPPSASELSYWKDKAALLDPNAYEYIEGASFVETVPVDECWYLINGWHLLPLTGAGPFWFHRTANVEQSLALPSGTVITSSSSPTSFAYICKPSLVIEDDDRYEDNPKELYFSRMRQLQTELPHYQIGAASTGLGDVVGVGIQEKLFPTDFTDGFVLHTSAHDVAWLILKPGGINTNNEISDDDPYRWAEPTPFPFKRTTFDRVWVRGAGMASGTATLTYTKLPVDW